MAISFDSFVNWAESKFAGQVVIKGDEVRLNSIFAEEDHKFHLWCSPKGGKHQREDGCYRCFKTDKRGTIIGLVMLVEGCSCSEAKELLGCGLSIRELEKELDEIFRKSQEADEKPPPPITKISLPAETYLISELAKCSRSRQVAERYLVNRKISIDGMYYCVSGKYRERIIIPYYDRNGNLIYFNGRHIGKSKLKYRGPEKEIGIGKGDVLFMPRWPQAGSKVYLTEGEFDAISLFMCEFNSAACGGKFLTDTHVELLRPYQVCLSLDTDPSGFQAIIDMGDKLLSKGIKNVSYVRPPSQVKDWNELLCDYNEKIMRAYVEKYEKTYDVWTAQNLLFNKL